MAMTEPKKQNRATSKRSAARTVTTRRGKTSAPAKSLTIKSAPAQPSVANPSEIVTDQTVIFLGEADYRAMEEAENRPISDMPGLAKLMSKKSVLE